MQTFPAQLQTATSKNYRIQSILVYLSFNSLFSHAFNWATINFANKYSSNMFWLNGKAVHCNAHVVCHSLQSVENICMKSTAKTSWHWDFNFCLKCLWIKNQVHYLPSVYSGSESQFWQGTAECLAFILLSLKIRQSRTLKYLCGDTLTSQFRVEPK